jgi:cyclohexa-1,5-dienecarbonyl-CoA hydratase
VSETIRATREGPVGTLTFERPPVNVLTIDMLEEMRARTDELLARGAEILVIRSTGSRAFSAGVDVLDHTPDRAPRMLRALHGLLQRLWDAHAVSIAVVHAAARGGGAELALACDLAVAAPEASFGFPEIQVGCFPPVAAALLPARLGPQLANDLVLTGRVLSAQEALASELVSRVAEAGQLDNAVDQLIAQLTTKSRAVRCIALERLRAAWVPQARAMLGEAERAYEGPLLATHDVIEGVAAFREKRPPVWSGS